MVHRAEEIRQIYYYVFNRFRIYNVTIITKQTKHIQEKKNHMFKKPQA